MKKIRNFSYINVWKNQSPEVTREIINFWLSEGALPNEENARKRAEEVVFIARDESWQIVGICTVYEKYNEQLENYFYYMRVYVKKAERLSRISHGLITNLKFFFETNYIDRSTTRSIGLMVEVENKALVEHHTEAVWPFTQFSFIGKNKEGIHQRVYYFKDARIM